MSLEQLEREIKQLSADDLAQFGQWFSGYLAVRLQIPDHDWQGVARTSG
jgi:hypothetical protein